MCRQVGSNLIGLSRKARYLRRGFTISKPPAPKFPCWRFKLRSDSPSLYPLPWKLANYSSSHTYKLRIFPFYGSQLTENPSQWGLLQLPLLPPTATATATTAPLWQWRQWGGQFFCQGQVRGPGTGQPPHPCHHHCCTAPASIVVASFLPGTGQGAIPGPLGARPVRGL